MSRVAVVSIASGQKPKKDKDERPFLDFLAELKRLERLSVGQMRYDFANTSVANCRIVPRLQGMPLLKLSSE